MKKIMRYGVLAAVFCLMSICPVQAENPNPPEPEAAPVEADGKAPGEPAWKQWGLLKAPNLIDKITGKRSLEQEMPGQDKRRDPFSATRKLVQKKQEKEAVQSVSHTGFLPGEQPKEMPGLKLKGHLQGKNNEVVALLEIQGGGVYIVREGDTIGLHEFGYDSVIRIQKISRLHLVVESGTLGRLIIVR